MMKHRIVATLAFCLMAFAAVMGQDMGLKTNLAYWGTATPNLAAELKIGDKWSAELSVGYNPFTFSDNKKLRHIAVQPELRYWTCQAFAGHFFGAHVIYSHYNAGGVHFPFGIYPSLHDYRYQGNLGGVGVAYGYNFILAPRWSLELEIGVGVLFTKYDKYECQTCGAKVASESKTFVSPTKAAVSIIYYL